ncbi:MAG: phosphoenolpyruvate synthase [Desulfobacterales bacterium]
MTESTYVLRLEEIDANATPRVGGKNASLGEMIQSLKEENILVPDGFATTADAYQRFIEENGIKQKIDDLLADYREKRKSLESTGREVRKLFNRAEWPEDIASEITSAYHDLCDQYNKKDVDVAVRSSATAEDLPEASFAGQQETFLNVTGDKELLDACRKCYASLFTDRAISYRIEKGFDTKEIALSVGVQKMVRSDLWGSGVMFTLDTETGFPDVVVINAAWGLGENVVQGTVNPDEYTVFKPLLTNEKLVPIIHKNLGEKEKKLIYAKGGSKATKNIDTPKKERRAFVLNEKDMLTLARWAVKIEEHYGKPMDIEWAGDGESGKLYIVQARPETVQSRKKAGVLNTYSLKESGTVIVKGLSIGNAIAAGEACLIKSADHISRFKEGAILVTEMTDPDWVPIMKKSIGIITDHGGRTCHAAIVSRELGIPAVVGCGNATEKIANGDKITLSCAQGDEGYIYKGILDFEEKEIKLEDLPETRTRIMMNIASPAAAFSWWSLPAKGIGLARMEFIINNIIQIHPMALIHYHDLKSGDDKRKIDELTSGFDDKSEYFIDLLAQGIARIAASQHPEPVIVRMSDFKTNEYANLIGGKAFEPQESNPMIGFRGASRYYSDRYRGGFSLECKAIRRVREAIGLTNTLIMIPFCRTIDEAERVLEVLAENGLKRGKNGLEVYMMSEIPSNIILADRFSDLFDGFSIGSNDLTQLVLGVDRDSSELAHLFDEQNEAVKREIARLIKTAHKKKRKVGICGQAPSDHPEFAEFLVEEGIDSISLNPDSVIDVINHVAKAERKKRKSG